MLGRFKDLCPEVIEEQPPTSLMIDDSLLNSDIYIYIYICHILVNFAVCVQEIREFKNLAGKKIITLIQVRRRLLDK